MKRQTIFIQSISSSCQSLGGENMQLYSEKLRCFYQIVSLSRKSRETVKNKVIKATDTICKIFEAVWIVKLLSITSILLNTV